MLVPGTQPPGLILNQTHITWRPMTPTDLPHVLAIAGVVHTAYPEDAAVFAERLQLYPAGCLIWESAGRVVGYGISHPWREGAPAALNALWGEWPAKASTCYIHDIALLPEVRGFGAGSAIVALLLEQARAVVSRPWDGKRRPWC